MTTQHAPKTDRTDFEKWNDDMARRFNPDHFINRTSWPIRMVERRRLRLTADLLNAAGITDVLDVGCGAGNLFPLLTAQRVVGVDLSDTLLDLARSAQARPGLSVVKANAESLPFEAGSFNALVCSEVLEHVQKPEQVMAEMNRVARPGARVVITLPNEDLINLVKKIVIKAGLKKAIAGDYAMSDNMLDEWHQSEIEPEWVMKHAAPMWKLERIVAIPFWPAAFHRSYCFRKP